MKMITLIGENNKIVAINSDNILTINPDPMHDNAIIIKMIDGSSIKIPYMTIEEVVAKINTESNIDKLGQMTIAICDRISHLEDAMASGLRYVGRSCH
jgi:hypothetical protein